MKLRHRLIRWLAHGDLVIVNLEQREDGWTRPKELGGLFMDNVYLAASNKQVGIHIDNFTNPHRTKGVGVLSLLLHRSPPAMLNRVHVEAIGPAQ